MSLKEAIDILNDLIERHKQIALRLKLIEIEKKSIEENILGKISNLIEKTERFDKRISQKYINELLAEKFCSKSSYLKGSFDEKIILEFLKKQKNLELEQSSKETLEENILEQVKIGENPEQKNE